MAIRYNRSFSSSIRVLSFDLDDTLYYNEDVIQNAEKAQFEAVTQLLGTGAADAEYWSKLKWQVAESHVELCHDVTNWRRKVIETGLLELGVSKDEISAAAKQVFDRFYDARSDFEVPQQTFDVLTQLRAKFPLVAATNGNVDIHRIGLSEFFVGYFRSGEQGTRMKPYPDMLNLAAQQLDVENHQILHIGDNEFTDVGAALNGGCHSLWFNPQQRRYKTACLADGEYSDLDDLKQLL